PLKTLFKGLRRKLMHHQLWSGRNNGRDIFTARQHPDQPRAAAQRSFPRHPDSAGRTVIAANDDQPAVVALVRRWPTRRQPVAKLSSIKAGKVCLLPGKPAL